MDPLKPQRLMNRDGTLKAGETPLPQAPATTGQFQKIWFTTRGIVHISGLDDGDEVVLRFRAHEIAELEAKRGKGVLSMLNEESLGIGFLHDALIVGSAHMFIGKKASKGKKKILTDSLANRWIDQCEENGVPFEDLLQAVLKAVVGGMPGGEKYISAMDEANEGPPDPLVN